jgi:bacterioferritin-associated ferredoxin
MAGNRVICITNNVDYLAIRKAMITGVRTKEELVLATGICTTCEGCKSEVEGILSSVCGCKEVSLQQVIDVVNNGAKTVDEIGKLTGAGTGEDCGKCKSLIQNIIDLGR